MATPEIPESNVPCKNVPVEVLDKMYQDLFLSVGETDDILLGIQVLTENLETNDKRCKKVIWYLIEQITDNLDKMKSVVSSLEGQLTDKEAG